MCITSGTSRKVACFRSSSVGLKGVSKWSRGRSRISTCPSASFEQLCVASAVKGGLNSSKDDF